MLSSEEILKTTETIASRLAAEFPESGLSEVGEELVGVAKKTKDRVHRVRQSNIFIRVAVGLTFLAAVLVAILGLGQQTIFQFFQRSSLSVADWAQILEAGANLFFLGGTSIFILMSTELRWKRRVIFSYLHELRNLAHVVDMHQLRKDPVVHIYAGRKESGYKYGAMTNYELARYLDYCIDMLALVGKLSAMYGECAEDPEITSYTHNLETLTNMLGQAIWQKIVMLEDELTAIAKTA